MNYVGGDYVVCGGVVGLWVDCVGVVLSVFGCCYCEVVECDLEGCEVEVGGCF